jgi:chlorite dismutase
MYPPTMHPAIFRAGADGIWKIESVASVRGESLPNAQRLDVQLGAAHAAPGDSWALRGVAGHERYTERSEHDQLKAVSPPLGRPEATSAALIPIRKSPAWWALSQDERRSIFEPKSRHIQASLSFLPRIARRLYHARDLGEPFDFLTWFEFAPEHRTAFDELVTMLRATEEWTYVDREVDIRLSRAG